jgi:oligopeptide/dipeptide ABC transporter ATP-binding protein
MTLAVVAALVGAMIGYAIGIAAALMPPVARSFALRAIDTALAFPGIIVAIFVSAIVGPGAVGAALGVGIALSFSFARVSSALALSVGGRDYVLAARILGIGAPALMARYVIPNVAEPLIIQSTVAISTSIVQVSSLSFLGLGVQPPDFDWGTMLTDGVRAFYINPAAALGPAVAIALSSLAFGFSGEALARAMNPALWTGSTRRRRRSTIPAARDAIAHGRAPAAQAAPPSADVALDVRDLTVTFPLAEGLVRLVDGVTFTVRKGQMVGIVGESGSGKTMTALGIAQLTPYPGTVAGAVRIAGDDIRAYAPAERERLLGLRLAIVFQDPMASLNPALTVGTQLTEGARIHRRLTKRAARQLAVARLREVNIPAPEAQLDRRPHELSGGMRQRVMIAMALMNDPAVLLADEPTTALDVTIQAQIMELLAKINREHGTAVVLISHNIGLVGQNCDRVLVMYGGRIVEDGATEALMNRPRHPYTRLLVAAVPDMERSRAIALASIAGQPPDPGALPIGCAFAARCPLVMDRCRAGDAGA